MTILASRASERRSSFDTLDSGSSKENISLSTGAVRADRSGLAAGLGEG